MSGAFLWGLVGGSSLVLGGVVALTLRDLAEDLLGLIMAFGAGVLISAVAYELVDEAFDTRQAAAASALGLFAGAGASSAATALIDRLGGGRKSSAGAQAGGSAFRDRAGHRPRRHPRVDRASASACSRRAG